MDSIAVESLPAVVNPIDRLLADKRSPATRRAYAGDLRDFFGGEPTAEEVGAFLRLRTPEVALRLNDYKARMMERGYATATVNRRLAAVRSLLKFSHRIGVSVTDGWGLVDQEKVRPYRDTRGVDTDTLKQLVALPDTRSLKGLRDAAILRLLCENGLRCNEVISLDVSDLDGKTLFVKGKGCGVEKELITLTIAAVGAIKLYLEAAGHQKGPLFRNMDRRPSCQGERLTGNGLRDIIRTYGAQAGIKKLTPHKLRHSCITTLLDATKGDVRSVQKLSRHSRLSTLMIYDDNRTNVQGELSELMSQILG